MAKLVFYLFVFIGSITMNTTGYSINTWQNWVMLACLIGANICGIIQGHTERRK